MHRIFQYTLVCHSILTSSALLLLASSSDPGDWSEWSTCSQSCDSGLQTRNRTCAGCNETQQIQECNTQRCYDFTLQLVVIILVTAAVVSIMTSALFCIFLRKNQRRRKHTGSTTLDFSTCNKLRTFTTDNAVAGACVESRSFYLQRLMNDSRASLEGSRQTLS